MEELIRRLNAFPNSYFGFVAGISTYAEKDPERLRKVMDYLDSSEALTTSDLIRFVSEQPDFIEEARQFEEQAS